MYVKLFAQLLDSSVWLESGETRLVWITLLLAMDQDGFARFASVANLAHRARVDLDAVEKAIVILEAPDPYSSDTDHDGRRIERIPGGWMILNAQKYRELAKEVNRREKTRERTRIWRENGKPGVTPATSQGVTIASQGVNGDAPVTKCDAMQKQKEEMQETRLSDASIDASFSDRKEEPKEEPKGVLLLAPSAALNARAREGAPAKRRDEAFDLFAAEYSIAYEGVPYQSHAGDFVQLAKLRKTLAGEISIDAWSVAIANYLATPQRSHTIADLAVNFATFRRAALDQFARPIDTRLGKTTRHNLAVLDKIKQQERERLT